MKGLIKAIDDTSAKLLSAGQSITDVTRVVKELLENGIDAGASRVWVRVENFGLDRIEVEDNGSGLALFSGDFFQEIMKKYSNAGDCGKIVKVPVTTTLLEARSTSKQLCNMGRVKSSCSGGESDGRCGCDEGKDRESAEGSVKLYEAHDETALDQRFAAVEQSSSTLGFRGEALHAMSQMSCVEVETMSESSAPLALICRYDPSSATIAKAQGLEYHTEVKAVMNPERKIGTKVTVSALFKNFPVRRRDTEKKSKLQLLQAVNLVKQYAVSHPWLQLCFTHQEAPPDGRTVTMVSLRGTHVPSSPHPSGWWSEVLLSRGIADAYGGGTLTRLKAVTWKLNVPSMKREALGSPSKIDSPVILHVRGFVWSLEAKGRSTKDWQVWVVDGRLMDLPRWSKSLESAYRSCLPPTAQSRHVAFFLHVWSSASEKHGHGDESTAWRYDVNLSPDKRQVLMVNEQGCAEVLYHTAQKTFWEWSEGMKLEGEIRNRGETRTLTSEMVESQASTAWSPSSVLMKQELDEEQKIAQQSFRMDHENERQRLERHQDAEKKRLLSTPKCFHSLAWPGAQRSSITRSSRELFSTPGTQERRSGSPVSSPDSFMLNPPDFLQMSLSASDSQSNVEVGGRGGLSKGENDSFSDSVSATQKTSSGRCDYVDSVASVSQKKEEQAYCSNATESPMIEVVYDRFKRDREESSPPLEKTTSSFYSTFPSTLPRLSHFWECALPSPLSLSPTAKYRNINHRKRKRQRSSAFKHEKRKEANLSLAEQDKSSLEQLFSKKSFLDMEVLGQFNHGFIICSVPIGVSGSTTEEKSSLPSNPSEFAPLRRVLMVVDQHASDERATYERLLLSYKPCSQPLVAPFCLSLGAEEVRLALQHRKVLEEQHGFKVGPVEWTPGKSGKDCGDVGVDQEGIDFLTHPTRLMVHAVPVLRYETVYPTAITELLQQLDSSGTLTSTSSVASDGPQRFLLKAVWHSLATKACRSSIMIGTPLSYAEMVQIVRHLHGLKNPWCCPHERPTLRCLGEFDEGWQKRMPSIHQEEYFNRTSTFDFSSDYGSSQENENTTAIESIEDRKHADCSAAASFVNFQFPFSISKSL